MYCYMIVLVTIAPFTPFTLEDGDRQAPMAVDLVDRLAILVAAHDFSWASVR
jgi:hypothetical protein